MNLFFIQWGAELRKMLARKRTYLGFGAFLVLEMAIYWLIYLVGVEKWFRKLVQGRGESFEYYFSALTLGFFVLIPSLLLSSIFVTLVGGDVVAKESEDGNLRLALVRPISRLRLLILKYLSCVVFSFVLIQFVVWTILLMGVALRGWGGGMLVFSPEENLFVLFDGDVGLRRYALSSFFLSLSMMGVGSVAFFLSCLRVKPATATITAMAYLLVDSIIHEMRIMDGQYNAYLLTHYMSTWRMVLMENIPWVTIMRNYAVLGGASLTLFVLGSAIFESRDLKS
jgi:ABC-2 type transport system permease protein